MDRECGTIWCRTGKGGLVRGASACGGKSSMSIPVTCPAGSRPHAICHDHPSGNPSLSHQDIATGKRLKVHICTRTVKHGLKCYRK